MSENLKNRLVLNRVYGSCVWIMATRAPYIANNKDNVNKLSIRVRPDLKSALVKHAI